MKIPRQSARSQRSGLSKLPLLAALTVAMGTSVAVIPMSAATAAPASVDSATSTSGLPTAVASGYKLTFSDEFNGPLDTSKWGYQYGCFDPGQRSQAQYTDSPDNVSVRDGYLNLTARYSPTKTKWDGSQVARTCKSGSTTYDAPFTSGMITTKYAAPASGFYAEARIKLPTARSSWSSFWATGTDEKLGGWPGNGEVDVFESKGYDPTYLMSNVHSPRASNPKKTEQHQGMMHGDTATSQSEFHTYGVLKSADAIEFYFDGALTHRVKMSDIKGPNPFVDPENNFTLKLNQMVGGNYLTNAKDWSDKTYVDATKFADDYKGTGVDGAAGSTMYVDYVRVYEPTNETGRTDQPAQPVDPTPVPSPEQPSQPAEPTPAPAPETPAQPENPAQPEQPAPVPTPAPEKPKPVTPAPAKPTPAKPQPAQPSPAPSQPAPAPAQPQPEQNQQAEQAQSDQQQSAQPDQPQKPEQPKKQQKPRPDRLANTGMTSWYRPVVVMWRSFCGWITSWWFW
jgi:beta-glucanase (GH16 family)